MTQIYKKYSLGILLSIILVLSACSNQPETVLKAPVSGADEEKVVEKTVVQQPKNVPEITIVSPKEDEFIKGSKVTVELKANNFRIVPVGEPVRENEGHFHVWLDNDKKVTPESMVTFENVVSGKHAIVAELYKSDHSSLSQKVAKTIMINVESDYSPPKQELQQGTAEFTVEADDNGFYPGILKAKIGDNVKINFKFKDNSIYFAGLDVKGPFDDIKYKLKGEQPIAREFTMKDEMRITSWWPSSGVKKATLVVEVEK